MSIRVVIIEDEDHAAQKLERALGRTGEDLELLTRLDSVASSIGWLSQNNADLIFCDIHLGDANSFEIFKKVVVKTPIIFTTAYDQYAIQAFDVNSIDYLLKPIKVEDLTKAINKFKERRQSPGALPIDRLMQALEGGKQPSFQKRFMVQFGEEIRTVDIEEVAYFFAEGKYTYLITHD
ncbi:MAG: LytTR family DNA-binding domain-containing protein, partial [Bacteroidota bacterium]